MLEEHSLVLIEKQVDQNVQIDARLNKTSYVKLFLHEIILFLLNPQDPVAFTD